MNKKIILALLGLALGSCGGPAPSSSSHTTGLSTDSSPSGSSSTTSSSDSGSASTSDSGASSSDSGASSSDSGSGGGSSSDSGSGTSTGTGTSSTDVPTEERKEKIVDFLTKDNGGIAEGMFVAAADIVSPLRYSQTQTSQYILQSQNMTVLYRTGDKKTVNDLWAGQGFKIHVGNSVAAYQELTKTTPNLPPVPEGTDVTTEEGANAYFKYFLELMYGERIGEEITVDCEKDGDYYVFSSTSLSGQSLSLYVAESADRLDFYSCSDKENYIHGSAPLGTEAIHGIYRSPLGGNFIQYARTHLEKVSQAIVEEGVGLLKIKFTELAKDPEAVAVSVFGNAPLSYVPDMTVSFNDNGSIDGLEGSLSLQNLEVKVKAVVSEDSVDITLPTNVVECEHPNPYKSTFEDELGGGHYHYCIDCNSVLDYGPHEYHPGDEHCHVCDFIETVEAPLKEGVVLPPALSDLKIIESKAGGNFLSIEGVPDISRGTSSTPLEGDYQVEFESRFEDGGDYYRLLAVGTQTAGEAKGCLYPMHWVVSYAKDTKDEPGTPVVVYEKDCFVEYHEKKPKAIEDMGDACHVYTVGECEVCHHEYGYPELTLNHKVEKKDNQDGTYTLTCSVCHESAVVRIGKAEPFGEEGHGVAYAYVSGNREIYEFFVYHTYLEDHVYEDGVCTVCGYKTTRKQVVVDLSSYVGEAATITLSLDQDREQQVNAKASTSFTVPMAARDPDSDEYHRGFALYSNLNFIVVAEPVSMPVFDTTCDFTEFWRIAVYPVELDEESQGYVIAGEALDTYEDPWDPAEVKHHQHTHENYTPTGEGCVYDGKFVCDACGEIVDEFTISLHEISVSNENEAYRLTCEHCHESVLVDSYFVDQVTDTYHAYRADGEILEASSPEFEKEAMAGLFASHSFDEEGNCVCGQHREESMTNYVWAHNLAFEDPTDVAGGVHITRDQDGRATSAELYGQGTQTSHYAGGSFEEWNYKAVDSDGEEVGLIHEVKHYVPYEDHLVMSEHLFSLSLNGIGDDVSYYALTDYDAQTPDYKTLGILISFELSGEADDVAGRINFQYEVEEGSKMLTGISYEGVGAAIPSLTKIEPEEEEGQRIEFKAFQIVDSKGDGLDYCFICEVHQHLEGEDWVEHETLYYISSFDPSEPPSDISSMYLAEVAHY